MLPLVFQINWILTFNHCKIPDVLSTCGFFQDHSSIQAKTYFYLQKNVLKHTRLLRWFASIGLTPTVAITIKLELQTNTYIYKRLKCYLLYSGVLMHFHCKIVYLMHCLHTLWAFSFIFKIARGYKQKLTFYLQNYYYFFFFKTYRTLR